MSIAFLFPGLGSQRPGMLHRLPDTAAAATVLAEADWALRGLASRTGPGGAEQGGEYADGIVELDSAEALERSPVACHSALLIAGVAGARAMAEDEEVRPSYVAGHGTGGFAAAVVAGVLTFEEALRAVRLKGGLLQRVQSEGLPESDVAIRLAQHLATVKRRPQSVRYLGGVQGRSLFGDTNAVFDDLAWSASRPVRWPEVISSLASERVRCCVELPPGRVLTGELAAAGVNGMQAVSVEEHGIAVAAELARGGGPGAAGQGGPAAANGAGQGTGPDAAPGQAGGLGGGPSPGPDGAPGGLGGALGGVPGAVPGGGLGDGPAGGPGAEPPRSQSGLA